MASDADAITPIVIGLLPFYFAYIGSAIIDGWLISKGKTYYNTFTSLIVNIVYYGLIKKLAAQARYF